MPKATLDDGLQPIRRKAIDPPLPALEQPARFTTGHVVMTLTPLQRDHLATTLAKRARIAPAEYVPAARTVLAPDVVREETVVKVNGKRRVQRRVLRTVDIGDAALPASPLARFVPDRDHSSCPRPEPVPEPARVVLVHETGEVIRPPRADGWSETAYRIHYADVLLWMGWMPAAVREEVRGA